MATSIAKRDYAADRAEVDNGLPKGWHWVNLEEIVENPKSDIVDGPFGSDLKASEYKDDGVPIIRIQNVHRNKFNQRNVRFVSHQKARDLKRHNFQPGDIVITKLGDPVGKACIVPDNFGPGIIVADIVRLRLKPALFSIPYIAYSINSSQAAEQVAEHVKGTTRPRVNLNHFRKLAIPLAPLAEQKRIVAKLEELLPKVNAVWERLIRVKEIMKRFRQSVLSSACSGRLTEDWRESRKDIEPAGHALRRAMVRRRKEYEAECATAKGDKRRVPPKPNYLEFRQVRADELSELPHGWEWSYLPFMGYMNRGKSQHRPRNAPHLYGGPYPFIQTGDIAQSLGRITSHRQTYNEAGLKQSKIWPEGTVCITIAANIAHSGLLTYPACFPDSVVGVVPDRQICRGEFLEYFIQTARSDLDEYAPATSQKNINIAILNDLAVPVPSLMEQEEIVRRVESLFDIAVTFQKRVGVELCRTEKLTQAVLAKAFRGELVPSEAEIAGLKGGRVER